MLTTDKLRNIVHRTRAIEGVHSNQVTYHSRLEFLHILAHTCRLKLEYTDCASFLEEFVCLRIINWNVVNINADAMCFEDILQTLLDDSQCFQSQEVHLNQSHTLYHVAIVFRHQYTLARFAIFHCT